MKNNNWGTPEEATQKLFNHIISGVELGKLKPVVCAKSAMVDARDPRPEEIGKPLQVWTNGKLEANEKYIVKEDDKILTTLNPDGSAKLDEFGHANEYLMPAKKLDSRYPKKINGHYVADNTPSVMVKLSDSIIPEEGITVVPPGWWGSTGTLHKGGAIMLPFDPTKSLEEQIQAWEKEGFDKIDWYPNNEPYTYSRTDKFGTFKDPELQATFGQTKQYEGNPYNQKTTDSGKVE